MILYQIVGLDRFAGVIKACPCCILISAFVLDFDIVDTIDIVDEWPLVVKLVIIMS